jgi:hypothetical protein
MLGRDDQTIASRKWRARQANVDAAGLAEVDMRPKAFEGA